VHPRVLLEQPDTSPGMLAVGIERDLAYGTHARHRLDLFLPESDKPFPVVLWIHAGAWSYGDKQNDAALAMRFAERGIGFAPMNYRLSSKAWNEKGAPTEGFFKHPAHTEDAAMAFAWLRKRFPNSPLFVAGHSCGAHTGALLGMDPRYLGKHGLKLAELRGVGAFGGGYDLVKYHAILASGGGKEWADAHLQWIFGDTREEWIAASPTTYLKGCTMPMYVVGEKGESMRQYTLDFEGAAKAAGVESIRFRYADDRTHGQNTQLMSRKAPDPIRDEFIAFVRERAR
jgi:acetyl esterase/lipase